MPLRDAISSFIKKLKCKCKCASLCEIEVSGNDVVDAIDEIEKVITPKNSPINSPNIIHRPLPTMPREEDEREYVAIK